MAYDAGGLITYTVLEVWIQKLFRLLQEPPLETYSPVSMQQVIRADMKLWSKVAEATRASIIPVAGQIKPLDTAFNLYMNDVEVTFLLLPLRGSAQIPPVTAPVTVVQQVQKGNHGDGPYGKTVKGGGKGKQGKGEGKGAKKGTKLSLIHI